MTILHGIEVDILPDGRLDFEDAMLERFDIVLASLHNRAGQDADRLTRRCLAAIRHPLVNVLCHPANRLVGHCDGYDLDFDALYAAAVETGTALEVDGAPSHMDPDGEPRARAAAVAGVTIAIDSDCHRAPALDRQMRFGVGTARRGWVEAKPGAQHPPAGRGASVHCRQTARPALLMARLQPGGNMDTVGLLIGSECHCLDFSLLAGPHPRSLSRGDSAPRSGRRRLSMLAGPDPRSGCRRSPSWRSLRLPPRRRLRRPRTSPPRCRRSTTRFGTSRPISSHTHEGGVLKRKREERGTLLVKKPGKMRWNYKAPDEKVFVSDGVRLTQDLRRREPRRDQRRARERSGGRPVPGRPR